jgi:hypothetical protein
VTPRTGLVPIALPVLIFVYDPIAFHSGGDYVFQTRRGPMLLTFAVLGFLSLLGVIAYLFYVTPDPNDRLK